MDCLGFKGCKGAALRPQVKWLGYNMSTAHRVVARATYGYHVNCEKLAYSSGGSSVRWRTSSGIFGMGFKLAVIRRKTVALQKSY